MENIQEVQLKKNSQEEFIPGFSEDFPHISSYVQLDKYICPWHFHKEIELFYVEQGTFEYHTPDLKMIFPAGSAGIINANVLHMARVSGHAPATTALLHLFNPVFISGQMGNVISQKYILPIIHNPYLEMLGFYPKNPSHQNILSLLQKSFQISETDYGYELKLREILSHIWIDIFKDVHLENDKKIYNHKTNTMIKGMLSYIHDHYAEKITVRDIATSVYISERECYRIFHDDLHMTPMQYLLDYRLHQACDLLISTDDSIMSISYACGFVNHSYFGKVFRQYMGYTPVGYREKWQNSHM